MKHIIFIYTFLIMTNTCFSQEPTNPAAKSYYKSLKKLLEKLATMDKSTPLYERDLNSAEEKVVLIEKYEPAFSYPEKETFLKLQKQFNDNKNLAITRSNNSYELKKELNEFFKTPYSFELGKANPKEFYESFKTKSDGYKQNDSRDNYKEAPDNLKNEARGFDVVIKDIEKSIDDAGSDDQATVYFYRTKVYIAYWELALYFEPNNSAYKDNLKAIRATEAKIGNLESIKANIIKKAKERADKKQMPAAVRKDPDLENKIKISFLSVAKKMGESFEITEINLISNDWLIIRNQYTGVIVKRSQSAAIAVKKNNKCFVYDFVNYYQQYDGSKYLGGECGTDYDWPEEINCANIK